jgi:hypothetical protein
MAVAVAVAVIGPVIVAVHVNGNGNATVIVIRPVDGSHATAAPTDKAVMLSFQKLDVYQRSIELGADRPTVMRPSFRRWVGVPLSCVEA